MSYVLPICPTGCADEPAPFEFDICAPVIRQGPIEFLYIAKKGAGFADYSQNAEWTSRINNATSNPTDIRQLHGIGTWAEAESNDIPISGNRIYSGLKTFTISFIVDETSDINYEALRAMECTGNYSAWLEDSITSGDARVYGDNDGINMFLKANFTIEADENSIHKIVITGTWKSKFHPARVISPITHP